MTKPMKHLKSTYAELRSFLENISVQHVLETLKCCSDTDSAVATRELMENWDFDVMGLKENGQVFGYVKREALTTGTCRDHKKMFHPSELISKSTPLATLFPLLHDSPRMFVLDGNRVVGIVTRGDLQKAPVRILLFGLVTLLEMHLLRLIRDNYPNESWRLLLKTNRIKKAKQLFAERRARNEAIDLTVCLQLCDKRDLIMKTDSIRECIEAEFKKPADSLLRPMETLRDKLAHAQDIVVGTSWPEVIDLIGNIERLVELIEPM